MLFFTSLLEFKATHWHQELKNHTRPVRMVFWKISVKNEVKRKKRWTMISLFYKGRRREKKEWNKNEKYENILCCFAPKKICIALEKKIILSLNWILCLLFRLQQFFIMNSIQYMWGNDNDKSKVLRSFWDVFFSLLLPLWNILLYRFGMHISIDHAITLGKRENIER